MTRARLSPGEVLSAAAGVVLASSTLLPWFQRETTGRFTVGGAPADPGDLNAWQAFAVVAVVLLLVSALPVWQAVRRARLGFPIRPQLLVAAGALAVTVVLGGAATKLGNEGTAGVGTTVVSTTAATGLLVAALAALLIAVGGVVAMWGSRPLSP